MDETPCLCKSYFRQPAALVKLHYFLPLITWHGCLVSTSGVRPLGFVYADMYERIFPALWWYVLDKNQCLCQPKAELSTKNEPKASPPPLPGSFGFGFGVQLGSLERKCGVDRLMPYWFICKWKWIYVCMYVRMFMYVVVYMSRLGVNPFPSPWTPSGSIPASSRIVSCGVYIQPHKVSYNILPS